MKKIILFFFILAWTVDTCQAQLDITNNTDYTLFVSIAWYQEYSNWEGWQTKGWYEISPGETFRALSLNDLNFNKNIGTTLYYGVSRSEDDWWRSDGEAYFVVNKSNAFEISDANKKSTLSKNNNYIWKKFHKVDARLDLLEFKINVSINEIYGCNGNCENGKGTYTWVYAGKLYTGDWLNGKRTGQGKCTYSSINKNFPNCSFEGKWRNNDWIEGTFTYANGEKYIGEFLNKKRHGKGTHYDASGRVFKTGIWANDQLVLNQDNLQATDENEQIESENYSKPKVWAVIVGISEYNNNNQVNNLRYADKDAQEVFDFLQSPQGGNIPTNQIRLLKNHQATRENILRAMESLFDKSSKNDLILFFFSGHGGPNFFVGYDQYVQHRDLRTIINRSKAGKKLCVADACHSGTWDKEIKSQNKGMNDADLEDLYYSTLAESGNGLALFMSSQRNEISLEDGAFTTGLFTYYYIKGLGGAADANFDRVISIQELYEYVKLKVSERAWKQYQHSQNPQIRGTFDHDMPVGVRR